MNPISPAQVAEAGTAAYAAKVKHAARDFEGVLLGELLRSLQQTFSTLPGSDPSSTGSDHYQYICTEALASGLAASGGFGVASMIAHNLLKTNAAETTPFGREATKVSSLARR